MSWPEAFSTVGLAVAFAGLAIVAKWASLDILCGFFLCFSVICLIARDEEPGDGD
jgi:hypothetical protein